MKTLVIEEDNEGLMSLMGQRILLLSAGYFYEGLLVGVNHTCVKLKEPHIVYNTGTWSDSSYEDIQSISQEFLYVQVGLIESFMLSKNK